MRSSVADINPLYNISTRLAIFGVRLVGVKIDVRGMEKLEAGHNYIFMANHTSNLDPPVLLPTDSRPLFRVGEEGAISAFPSSASA